jgi:hypothetical protein
MREVQGRSPRQVTAEGASVRPRSLLFGGEPVPEENSCA